MYFWVMCGIVFYIVYVFFVVFEDLFDYIVEELCFVYFKMIFLNLDKLEF